MAKTTVSGTKRIPFWAQICLILFCGIILSIITFFLVRTRTDFLVHAQSDGGQISTPETHKVTFAYQDGTVIDTKEVSNGKGVVPPTFKTEDVFRGWNCTINNVTADMETHPMVYQISSDDENLFYFDSVYVIEGEEFQVDLMLDGKVNISSASLNIEYDPEVMDFVESEDSGICDVSTSNAGTLVLNMKSDTPLQERTFLSELTFQAKKEDVSSTQISLCYEDAKLLSAGMEYPATVSTLNNKIYYLQEVD